MSVTGPGCAHCDGGRVTTPEGDRRPCDRCGGWSQFAVVVPLPDIASSPAEEQPTDAELALMFADDSTAPSPEADWRPLPSCAEVLAHSARMGGEAFAPWLRLPAGDDAVACVVMLAALDREATPGVTAKVVVELLRGERLPYPGDTYRPVTRRAEALPWPEVPR